MVSRILQNLYPNKFLGNCIPVKHPHKKQKNYRWWFPIHVLFFNLLLWEIDPLWLWQLFWDGGGSNINYLMIIWPDSPGHFARAQRFSNSAVSDMLCRVRGGMTLREIRVVQKHHETWTVSGRFSKSCDSFVCGAYKRDKISEQNRFRIHLEQT